MVFGFCAADEKNHKHDRNRSLLFNSMGGFDDGTTDELADSRRRGAERRAAKAEFPLHSNQGSFARRSSSIQPTSNGRHIVNSLARRRGVTSPPPIRTNDGARAGPPTPSNDNTDQTSTSHNASSIAPRGHSLDSTVAMAPTPPPTKKRYASPNSRPEAGSPPEMGRPPSPPSTRIMRRGLSPNNNGQATVSPTSSIRRTNTGSSRRTSSPSQEPPNLDGIMVIRRHRSPSPAARLDLLPTVNANYNASATVLDYQSNTQAPSPLSPSKNFPFNTDKTTPVSPKISIFAILQWVAILLIVLAVAGFALVVDGRQSSKRSSGILVNGQKLASSHHRTAGHGATHLSSNDQLRDSNDDADSDEYEDDDGEDDEEEIDEGTPVNSTTSSINANSERLLSSGSFIASALYPFTKSIYISYRLCAGSLAAAWDGLWWVLCFGGCAKPIMESPPTGNTIVTSNVSSVEAETDLRNESGIDAQAAAKVAKLAVDAKVARELKEAAERKANDERQALEAKAMKDATDRKAKEEADRKAAEELKAKAAEELEAKAAKKSADEHKAKVAKDEADRKAEKAAVEQRIKAAEAKVSHQIAVEDDEEDDDAEYEDEDGEDEDRIPSASFTSVWLGVQGTVLSTLQAIIDYICTGFGRMQSSATTLASAAVPKISSWIESLMDKLYSVFGGATTTIIHASNYSAEVLEQAAFHTIAFLRAVNDFLVTAINKNIEGIHAARGRNPSVTDALIGATVAVVLTVVGVYTKGGRKLLERGRHAVSPSLQAAPSEPPIVGNSPSSPRVIQLEATPPSRFVQPFLPTAETVSASTSPARGSIIPPFVPNGGLVPPIKPAFEPTTMYAPTLYPSSVAIKEAYRNRSVAMESNTDAVYTRAILAPLDAAITSEPSIQRAGSSTIGGYSSAYAGMTKRASPHAVRPYVVSTIDVEIQNLKRELDIVRAERASRSRAGSAATVHQPNGSRSPSPRAAQDHVRAAPITSSPPPSATNVFGPTSSRNTLLASASLAPSSSTISGTTGTYNNNTLAPNGGRSPDPSIGAKHAQSLSQPNSDGDLAALPIMGSGPGLAIPPPSITQNPSQTLSSISASATTNTLMQFSATVTPGTLAGAAQQGTEETSVTVPNLQHVSSEEGTTSTEKEDPLINSESSPSIAVDSHRTPTKPSLPNLSTILTVESRGNSTVILHDTVADSSSAAASPRHGHSAIEGIGYGLSVVSGIERKVDESGSGGVFPRPTNTVSQATTLVNLPAVSIVAAGVDSYAPNTTALDPTVKASPVKVTRHIPHAASSIDDFLHPSGAPMVVTGLSQRTYSGSDSQSHFFSYEPHFQKPQIIGADVDSHQRQAVIQQLLQLSPQKNSLAGNRQNTQNEGHPGHSDSSHPAITKELFGYANTPCSSIRPVVTPASSPGQSIQNEGVDFAATAVATTADEQGGANPSSSKRLLVLNGNMSPLVPKQPPPAPVLPPRAQPPSGDILRAKVRPPPPPPSKDPIIGGGEDSPRQRGHPLDASEDSEVVKASNEAFLPSIDGTPDSPSARGSNFKIIESVEVDGSPSAFFSPPKRVENNKTDPSQDASPPGSVSAPSSQHREITTSEVVDTPPALSAATSAHFTYAYSPVTEAHSHVTIDTTAESATIAFTDSPSDAELDTHDTIPHPKVASSHLPPMSPSKKLPPPPPPPSKKAPYTPTPVVVESEAPVAPPPLTSKKLPPPPPAKKSVPPPPAKQSPEASEGDLIMDKDALRKAKADYGSWF